MADNLPSDTSIAVLAAAAPTSVSSLEGVGEGGGEAASLNAEVKDDMDSSILPVPDDIDAPRPSHDAFDMSSHKGGEGDGASGRVSVFEHPAVPSTMPHLVASGDPDPKLRDDATAPTASAIQASSPSPQASAVALPPIKRFSSVTINKRFLEKTSSSLGTPQGGSSHAGSGAGNVNGAGQRRGTSPSSRSPSTDRPAPSRLVTAKLTAIPQPSVSSTSGWLRTGTPGSSAGPTPPSSSPQPLLHDAASTPSLQQSVKRRPGESPIPNGHSIPVSSQSSQQGKPVWGKVSGASPRGGLNNSGPGLEIQNDFPTAAEAAHGRKLKAMKASDAETAAAAQKAAQKQAMNETAAAFRGAHLDANVRHWDEMEDEDNDFLGGVIEFGDGTQYKVEKKIELPPSDEPPQEDSTPKSPISLEPVTKEERFGQDIGRSWPRGKSSPVQSTSSGNLPLRLVGVQPTGTYHSPIDGSASGSPQSPYDSNSPTSRVLFNERSNRLEPWSNAKAPFMPPRQQGPAHPQGREAPPHSSLASNVQLLQKGPSGPDSAWKSGPPRIFGSGAERGRWGEGGPSRGPPSASAKEEGQPWELCRRESMSSAAGSSVRDRSRGRERRWDTSIIPPVAGADRRDRGRRDSNISQQSIPVLHDALTHERSRERAGRLPSHIRMPPPPVPVRDPSQRLSGISPAMSARSLTSPGSERPMSALPMPMPTGSVTETAINEVDKDALVRDAMHLAIERARKRKQEGEEEEKRRLEAQERAKKKAEELAALLDEKRKADTLPQTKPVQDSRVQEPPRLLVKADRLPSQPSEESKDKRDIEASPVSPSTTRTLQNRHAPAPLLRKLPDISPAAQADSWRKAPVSIAATDLSAAKPVAKSDTMAATVERAQKASSTDDPRSPGRGRQGTLLSTTEFMGLDLSVKPDEQLEIVDFCDLGKFMGDSVPVPTELPTDNATPLQAEPSIRARRPVASDFFDANTSTNQSDSVLLPKSDQSSWRRPILKPAVPTSPPVDELRTQSMPIFSTEELFPVKEPGPTFDSKHPPSPTASQAKRALPHGDQASITSTSQSTHMSPVVAALRSPRASHFKEAPLSTLTDTMSRIKGALVGMHAQELPSVPSIRETLEKIPDGRSSQTDVLDSSLTSWRSQQDTLKVIPQRQAGNFSSIPVTRPLPTEVFDVTRSPPPASPRPVWNTFAVKLPKVSHIREILSRRQLHFWNLPPGPVRWDILSWDPPVEGMNKRELSRDELFHRRYPIKGGKPRVLLPTSRISRLPQLQSSHEAVVNSGRTLITEDGVKIKLPGVSPPNRPHIHRTSLERPRDSSVPSWRRSATPLTSLKTEKADENVSDHELNTTSRSPPPDSSTSLPQFTRSSKTVFPSRPQSAKLATVSLPPIGAGLLFSRRSTSGPDVAFFRTSKGDPDADGTKTLPRFTVTSELDSTELSQATLKSGTSGDSGDSCTAMSKTVSTCSPQDTPAETTVPRLVASKSESKSSDESASLPQTPPAAHNNATWGKSPLNFSLKESPDRRAPDPEHLKAVWSQPSGHPSGSTSNSLKGITDDLPSIPFTVQDMKSEDGGTPPPTAPVPTPSRLSLQEVTRAFQQVPDSPANRQAPYTQTPLLSQNHRHNQPMGVSFPPPPGRPAFAPYPHTMVGHSPSPTLMYAPGMPSPIAHHRMAVNGPSPPIAHGMWLPTPPPPPQPGSFIRPAGAPSGQVMYPSTGPVAPPTAPGQMMHRRVSGNPGSMAPPPAPMYAHQMDMNQMHSRSPHMAHAPVGHPMQHMHVTHVFSPPQPPVQAPTMYAVPVGAGRGGMMPRPGYDGYGGVPLNPGYQQVPTTSFVFQS
ncbi:hypothetical protein BU17DRAFT_81297 [Hysterangium stoloniferum]|nr:hypothetical protein BU17DRAFT_81297 [Hysterangium stoloniferum]